MNFKAITLPAIANELASELKRQGGNFLNTFKEFRKLMDNRLRLQHQNGGGGKEIARHRADLMDLLLRELLGVISKQTGVRLEGLVVAAFGGYGRREMNPFSDVDVMFIHQSRPTQPLDWQEVVRRTLVTLWDLGFQVGHSVRSLAQAIEQANADLVIKTSMLECRFLTGDHKVFNEFTALFKEQCVLGREAEYFAWRAAKQFELRNKFGASVFMQEPNVKSGCGGLRDYHNLLWNSYFKEGISSTAKLVEKRILRSPERALLEKGYDFLLRVRTELHYLNGRPQDQLTLRLQGQAAAAFHYPQQNILRRCEAFMRDYYQNARNVHLITHTALARMKLVGSSTDGGLLSLFIRRSVMHFDGFFAREGLIYPDSKNVLKEDPARILQVFQHAQVRQLEFSEELRDLIRRRLSLINRTFQYAKKSREIFLAILSRKGEVGRILRLMHDLGVLGKFIPEFGHLTCLVQHEFYHRYTADEHTLVCIEKLDRVLFSDLQKLAGYRALFRKIEDPSILYLSILLHDTGKAANTRHHEEVSTELAAQVARRFQLSPDRRRMLV
ncbi:MAG: [protein-PII] uridylyltransferase, partial [Verrucomicrobia bacterium]